MAQTKNETPFNMMDEVRKYFKYIPSENRCECSLQDCTQSIKGNLKANLKRHLISKHKAVAIREHWVERSEDVAEPDVEIEKEEFPLAKRPKTKTTMKIEMDYNTVVKGCIKLVTQNNLPLETLDFEGFRDILVPITDALRTSITSINILPKINCTAEHFRNVIISELKNMPICLKIDFVSHFGRTIMGLNVQLIRNEEIQVMTIAMIVLKGYKSSDDLKRIILDSLNQYNIQVDQLYSITIDNGDNMLKMIEMFYDGPRVDQTVAVDDNCKIKNSTNELVGEILNLDTVDEATETHNKDEVDELMNNLTFQNIKCVRCVAHSLQLVVNKVISGRDLQTKLDTIRLVVKKINSPKYQVVFRLNSSLIRPVLDVVSRWGSTFEMVTSVFQNRTTYETVGEINPNLKIDSALWSFMEQFSNAFEPIYVATKTVQEEQLIIGDFYKCWLKCKIILQTMCNNIYASLLHFYMQTQEKRFHEIESFAAAMFFDPRFNYIGSCHVSDKTKNLAKNHIKKIYGKIKNSVQSLYNSNNLNSTIQLSSNNTSLSDDLIVEHFLQEMEAAHSIKVEPNEFDLDEKLNQMCYGVRAHSNVDVLQYWETQKFDNPEMYALAKLILAVPATQVTVVRAFDAITLISNPKRIQEENYKLLQDILLVKFNSQLFDKINFD